MSDKVQPRQWNVIFFLNKPELTKIVLLKRSPSKTFAPNRYTGIGGKVEPGETIEQSAYRELAEETGIRDSTLTHFADCIIDDVDTISCFYSIYKHNSLPACNEGTLQWVPLEKLFTYDLIPTARYYLTEWKKRNFSLEDTWSIYVKETGRVGGMRVADVVKIQKGLYVR